LNVAAHGIHFKITRICKKIPYRRAAQRRLGRAKMDIIVGCFGVELEVALAVLEAIETQAVRLFGTDRSKVCIGKIAANDRFETDINRPKLVISPAPRSRSKM
jgi:hypothetical protein